MNMINKKILATLAFLPLLSFAQKVQVVNAEVNLGQIQYLHPATATYMLKNVHSSPITIEDVDTGCGCTKAEYPKRKIGPGEEFALNVTYDARQLGHFKRVISIFDSTSDTPTDVILSGNVVVKVENFSGDYPLTIGDLLADVNTIEFDDVHMGDRMMQEIHIFNPAGQYVEPVVMHLPSYLRAEVTPTRLAPKKGGVLRVTLNSSHLKSMGLIQSSIYLGKNAGEKVSVDKEIVVSAIVLPEQKAQDDALVMNAPHATLSTNVIDFSNFGGKAKKKVEVLLTNTGKSMLEIKSLQMFTMGLEVTLPKQTLKPGETTKMKITGNAALLSKVRQRPRLLMITNDPTNPKLIIEVQK